MNVCLEARRKFAVFTSLKTEEKKRREKKRKEKKSKIRKKEEKNELKHER